MSVPLSLCCLHIRLHLTSISVKETGASGSCPITAPHLLFRCLPYPAIPPIFCSLQGPFSDLPLSATPFVFHVGSFYLTKCLIFAGNCYTSVPTCCLMAFFSQCMPYLWIQLFTGTYLYSAEKTAHNRVNQYKTLQKLRVYTQHLRVFTAESNYSCVVKWLVVFLIPLRRNTPLDSAVQFSATLQLGLK